MEEKSLKITGTSTTFFNKITRTLTKMLIPTQIGINGMLITLKRNSLLKAYENYIKDTELFYIDSSLSCVVELIGYFSKYMKVDIPSITATIMLAGMEIDTNGFNIKITEKAFICAGYLISEGADPILKQQLLQEEKNNFLRRADFIKSSYIYKKKYAICLLASTKTTQMELAEVSDELLKFEGVVASFTIGQLEKKIIGISARSLGNVDVCNLMKQLGGGGHATDAATQVNNTTIKALEARLQHIIDKE